MENGRLLMDALDAKMECGCIKVARRLGRHEMSLERGRAEVASTDCMSIASGQQHKAPSMIDCTIRQKAKKACEIRPSV